LKIKKEKKRRCLCASVADQARESDLEDKSSFLCVVLSLAGFMKINPYLKQSVMRRNAEELALNKFDRLDNIMPFYKMLPVFSPSSVKHCFLCHFSPTKAQQE